MKSIPSLKAVLLLTIALFVMVATRSQTLFTYGKYSVDVKDFLRAYNKNNTQPVTNKAKSVSDYLELYIRSRLKIREAYERGYDTLSLIKSEVDNLRAQIVENYMNDPETVTRLSKEAFQRSQKDIHVASIFISAKGADGQLDTVAALRKKDAVLQRLQKGDDFLTVARENSDDPSAKDNLGDLGYITVFSLPYEFENIIYATPSGKYSTVYRSRAGYHIFKNLGERKAMGKIKAQQILLALPPGADDATKKQLAGLADSLYKRLLAGDDFGSFAKAFSNDYISAATGGNLPDIGVGQYDPVFENALWSLPKDGDISKPFMTAHGWHIVKRVSIKPIVTDPEDKINKQDLQQRITADARWKSSRSFIYDRVVKKVGLKKFPYSETALWAYSDSILDNRTTGVAIKINQDDPLFRLDDSTLTVLDWIAYAQAYRYKSDGTGAKPYPQVMDEFVQNSELDYYRNHLESFNEEFRRQMEEFRDGNLFFEIMQREIWNKAQGDSDQFEKLYTKNKQKYMWQKSADAVIFFCSDPTIASAVFDAVKKDPSSWHRVADSVNEKMVADSGRYEWNQIPNLKQAVPEAGMVTEPLINKTDNTASFAYIIKVYPQPVQRSFAEAKGLVINDYQSMLEEAWTKQLKKKYPVVINQKVLASISK